MRLEILYLAEECAVVLGISKLAGMAIWSRISVAHRVSEAGASQLSELAHPCAPRTHRVLGWQV